MIFSLVCLENCDLYKYADDNTTGVCGNTW